MGSELEKLRKQLKLNDESAKKTTTQTSGSGQPGKATSNLSKLRQELGLDDIAPTGSSVSYRVTDRMTTKPDDKKKDEENRKWYDKGFFDDGYNFGDLTKAVFGVLKDAYSESAKPLSMEEDIAPVKPGGYNSSYTNSEDVQKTVKEPFTLDAPVTERAEQKSGFFQKGALEDKEDENRIAKAIIGSAGDVGSNFMTGLSGGFENMLLGASQFGAAYEAGFQNQNSLGLNYQFDIADYREKQAANAELIKKGIWDEEWLGRTLIDAPLASIGVDTGGDSVFGARSDGMVRSAGDVIGRKLLSIAMPGKVLSFLSAAGAEAKESLDSGSSSDKALVSSVISGAGEVISEMISGAIKFGDSALDDTLVKSIGSVVKNRAGKFLAKLGINAAGEGLEEIVSGSISAVGKKLTYMDDKQFKEIFSGEDAMNSFVDGAIMGLLFGSVDSVKETVRGNDVTTGLSKNEQKAVDTVFKNSVAEAKEKNGGKVSPSERVKLYQSALNSIDKGYISIEAIEEALGGDSYERYKNVSDQAKSVSDELDRLGKKEHYTLEDQYRYAELKASQQDLNKAVQDAKKQLETDTYAIAKDSRLVESYNEKARRGQAFDADLTKYDTKQQAVVQKAIDSGILNNTNRTHDFVDFISRVSADKDVPFDFINNVKLKESGFALDGKQVNGFVTKDGIMLNIDSAKAMNAVVGHEIMHVLKGTEHFKYLTEAAYNCAIYKDGLENFNKRLKETEELYKGMDADPNEELAADLIGEYLFTDPDFISRLSTENRNVFQKIYDEIKYLCKVATAGSKEARELEKLKRAFEDAYRESGTQKNTTEDGGVMYSISKTSQMPYGSQLEQIEKGKMNGSNSLYVGKPSSELQTVGLSDAPFAMNQSDYRKSRRESAKNKNYSSHSVPYDFFENMPQYMAGSPILIDNGEKVSVITSYGMKDTKGNDSFVIAGVWTNQKMDRDTVNQVKSVYPWDDFAERIRKNAEDGKLVVTNKNKAEQMLVTIGIQPAEVSRILNLAKGTLSQQQQNVKYSIPGVDGDTPITEQQNERGQNAVRNDMDIAPVRSLSNEGQQHTPDSLSALRLEAPVSSEADTTFDAPVAEQLELPYGAPIADDYTAGTKNTTTTTEQTASKMSADDIAPTVSKAEMVADSYSGEYPVASKTELPFGAPVAEAYTEGAKKATITTEQTASKMSADDIAPIAEDYIGGSEAAKPVSQMTDDDVAPIDMSNSPVLKRLNQKVSNLKTELENNQRLREESARAFDEKIKKVQDKLDSKKNKETKIYNNLLRRIERLKRQKADVDAEYAKRIGDIRSRIKNAQYSIQKYHPGLDRAEKAIARIDSDLDAEKAKLTEEYNLKKEQLADKDSYFSQKATELYNEIRNLKKGVKASEQLGYLLDHGYDWSSIKAALINIKHTPGSTVNIDSQAESVAREMLSDAYETSQYDLEVEYLKQIRELEAKADEKRKKASIANQRKYKMEEHTKRWENLVGDTSTWKDMPIGLSYKTRTLRRILRKVVKDANGNEDIKKADAIYDELETKYDHNEALLKKESQKLKEVFFELDLNNAEDTYAHMLGELRYNPETTLTEDVVKDYYEKHQGKIDTSKVDKAISEARNTFSQLLVRVNEVLREQGMKEIPYRKGYFPHFSNPKQGWLAKLLNWKTIDNEIPTSIAGLTEMFNPQRSWQSFSKQRMGDKTDYSLYHGLDTYIHGALDWIYHIDDLQSRRALENYLRYTHSEEGVKARIDEIKANDSYDADEAQKMIESVLDEANNPLSGLVRELRNRTNTLANKKSSMDRGMEDATNRKIYSTMTNLNNRITANQVVGSISSALTNFIPMVQSWHEVSPYFTVRGLGDYVRSTVKDDGMVYKSDFLTNRLMEEEKLYQTGWDKVSDKAAFMMNVIDSITSQTVWRSKYLQNLNEGMSKAMAIKNADQFAKNLMAGRSKGNMPTIFDAKNPLIKMFTSFQLEVANQYGYMFEDVPKDSKSPARLVTGYAKAFLGAYMYNALYSSLVGRDAAFDPIGIIEELLRDLFDEDKEPEDIILDTGKNIIEELPFVGGLFGGGRVPISSAFPYSGYTNPFESMLNDLSEGDMASIGKEMLKPLYYLAMPVAGGQIKKTVEGLSMFSDDHPIAGSYTTAGNLRFSVEDTLGSRIQAGLFGQYASENARKYFDQEQRTLNPEQTEILAGLDIPIEEYWGYRDKLYDFYDVKDKLKEAAYADGATAEDKVKWQYIDSVYDELNDLYDRQKETSSGNSKNKTAELRKIQNQMERLLSDSKVVDSVKMYGSYAEIGSRRYNYDPKKNKWYEIKPKNDNGSDNKYYQKEKKVTNDLGISKVEYWNNRDGYDAVEYFTRWEENGEVKFDRRDTVKNIWGYKEFFGIASQLNSIKADKNKYGYSISGSKQKKIKEAVYSMDIPEIEKHILFKLQYNKENSHNRDIVNYLNARDDISYSEMEAILLELGFKVDDKGNISW